MSRWKKFLVIAALAVRAIYGIWGIAALLGEQEEEPYLTITAEISPPGAGWIGFREPEEKLWHVITEAPQTEPLRFHLFTEPSHDYARLEFLAYPIQGYEFVSWEVRKGGGEIRLSENPITLKLESNAEITAHFRWISELSP